MKIDLSEQECGDILYALNGVEPNTRKHDLRIGKLINRLVSAKAQAKTSVQTDTVRRIEPGWVLFIPAPPRGA